MREFSAGPPPILGEMSDQDSRTRPPGGLTLAEQIAAQVAVQVAAIERGDWDALLRASPGGQMLTRWLQDVPAMLTGATQHQRQILSLGQQALAHAEQQHAQRQAMIRQVQQARSAFEVTMTQLVAQAAFWQDQLDRYWASPLGQQAREISATWPEWQAARQLAAAGWSVDGLTLLATDEMVALLRRAPQTWTEDQFAQALAHIVSGARDTLAQGAAARLTFLLGPERGQEFSQVLDEALESVATGRGVRLITQAMLARADGVFKWALSLRGVPGSDGLLYANQQERARNRQQFIDDAIENAAGRGVPIWLHPRAIQDREALARRVIAPSRADLRSGPADAVTRTRNHAQHDGSGTGTLVWAVRALAWFLQVTVTLSELLEPLPAPDPDA